MAKLCEVTGIYICDECGKEFEAKDVKLKPYSTNVSIFTDIFIVDKNDKILSTINAIDTDRVLCCPYCEKTHLFGFIRKKG